MRKTITATIAAAAAAAAMSGAGIALASTGSAGTSGAESFQMMSTSGTNSASSVIAHGVFTGAGADHEHAHNNGTFVFRNGTVRVHHTNGKGRQSFNPKTCLLTVSQRGAYRITGGTGKYAGITGGGRYQLSILAVGARSGGKCSQSKPPLAFHQVIDASGTASLK
jgi:hypothetical protein